MNISGSRKLFFDSENDIIVLGPENQWVRDEIRNNKIRDAGMFSAVKTLAVSVGAGWRAYGNESEIFPHFNYLEPLIL